MAAAPIPCPAWRVVAALHAEIARQVATHALRSSRPDQFGRVRVEGQLDLAALADAAEAGLIEAFPPSEGTNDGEP